MAEFDRHTCRGSWALGSACGECERCETSRPSKNIAASATELFGELQVISRSDPHVNACVSWGRREGLTAEQVALQAAILLHKRAKELEKAITLFYSVHPSPLALPEPTP